MQDCIFGIRDHPYNAKAVSSSVLFQIHTHAFLVVQGHIHITSKTINPPACSSAQHACRMQGRDSLVSSMHIWTALNSRKVYRPGLRVPQVASVECLEVISSPSVNERERFSVLNRRICPISPGQGKARAKQIANRGKAIPRLNSRLS